MGIICLFLPAVIFCSVREMLQKRSASKKKPDRGTFERVRDLLLEYACGNITINVLIILGRLVFRRESGSAYDFEYNSYAVKYLGLAVILSVLLPCAERYFRDNITLECDVHIKKISLSQKVKDCMVFAFAIFLASHHFIRMFDNSVWGDEGIVVLAVRKTWMGMLEWVAENGHSPFHYAFAWLCVQLSGGRESGFIFHLSATLPYFIIIVLSITLVRKWFGNKAAIIFVTLCSLLSSAIHYNLEIRMYVWCQLFIFSAFLVLYKLYRTWANKYYLLLALFSLGAVYTHYFALAGIGLMYLILFIYVMVKRRKHIWKVFLSGSSVLVLLTPWLIFSRNIRGVVISDYGIAEVSWETCIKYIFSSEHPWFLLGCFFLTVFLRLAYDLNIVKVEKREKQGRFIQFCLMPEQTTLSIDWIWLTSGVIAVFGTIAAAQLISFILYPITVLRYLYPAYIIIWLLFAINVSKLHFNKIWTLMLITFIFLTCYPLCIDYIKREYSNNKRLEETLALTRPKIDQNDFIYTDIVHFAWTVGEAYYPDTPNELFGHAEWWGPTELPVLDLETQYWLFLDEPIAEDIAANLDDQDKSPILIVDDGYIGTGSVWIYKIVPDESGK